MKNFKKKIEENRFNKRFGECLVFFASKDQLIGILETGGGGGAHYDHPINTCLPGFSDLATSLINVESHMYKVTD